MNSRVNVSSNNVLTQQPNGLPLHLSVAFPVDVIILSPFPGAMVTHSQHRCMTVAGIVWDHTASQCRVPVLQSQSDFGKFTICILSTHLFTVCVVCPTTSCCYTDISQFRVNKLNLFFKSILQNCPENSTAYQL